MESTIIVAATPNLEKSLEFYKKLEFNHFEEDGKHYVKDGDILVEISDERGVRSGLKMFKEDWGREVDALKKITSVAKTEGGFVLMDFCGVWIQLIEGSLELRNQPGESKSILGNIAGLSLEGISIPQMFKIWKVLGFKKTMGSEEGGWMSIANVDMTISLMSVNACPHSFYNPSLTYFNGGKNLPVIEAIQSAGIPITEEITVFNDEGVVDNVIIRDPGGFGFFVFND